MINQKMRKLGAKRSVIRELFEYGKKRKSEIGEENVYDFSLGNPYPPAPDCLTETLDKLIKNPSVHAYTSAPGAQSVREAVANSITKRFGVNQPASLIYMTAGAAASLCSVLSAIVEEENDKVIVFAPYFPEYKVFVESAGAKVSEVLCNDKFLLDKNNLEKALDKDVVAVIINSPNNPTGAVYPKENLEEIFALLESKEKEYGHAIYLISDEPYREIAYDGVEIPYVTKYYKNTFVCYSYSKSLSLPGERIGYIAVNPACQDSALLVDMFGQISRGIGHNCPPSIIQLAVSKALYDTADLSVYETNKNILYTELTKMGFDIVEPGGTFYMFPRALCEDANEFCWRAAKELNLIIVPGDSFNCPGHFRISYCVNTDMVERSIPAFEKLYQMYKN